MANTAADGAESLDGLDDIKRDVPIKSYAHWGGLPATVAALEGFEEARHKDPAIAMLTTQLNRTKSEVACDLIPLVPDYLALGWWCYSIIDDQSCLLYSMCIIGGLIVCPLNDVS